MYSEEFVVKEKGRHFSNIAFAGCSSHSIFILEFTVSPVFDSYFFCIVQ